ncbi:hypothetical protein HYI05_18060 [Clostridium botulinum]|nr:hypothetical protein [Clostridium botulinum]
MLAILTRASITITSTRTPTTVAKAAPVGKIFSTPIPTTIQAASNKVKYFSNTQISLPLF